MLKKSTFYIFTAGVPCVKWNEHHKSPIHYAYQFDRTFCIAPVSAYIFSADFRPGLKYCSEHSYRNFWSRKIVPALNFPKEYKFYSLKDSGITAMLRSGLDALSVKEQARHSSLLMIDIYTPQDIRDANPILVNYKGIL